MVFLKCKGHPKAQQCLAKERNMEKRQMMPGLRYIPPLAHQVHPALWVTDSKQLIYGP